MTEIAHGGGAGKQHKLVVLLDKTLAVQQPLVDRYVARVRRGRPGATPSEMIAAIESYYLAGVTATGAGVGGSAAAPGVGTGVAIALSVGEVATFLEASVLFSLAVADIHGVQVEDLERRRTLVLAVLLGDSGVAVVEKAASRTGQYWGKHLTSRIPLQTIKSVNKVLGRNFVTKYGTKQGIIVIGRIAPFGIGAMIGGAGNALLGRAVITGARRAFGPPPDEFPT